jgi:hypothetical protein
LRLRLALSSASQNTLACRAAYSCSETDIFNAIGL